MDRGINSTFRQVGISTGVAALGSIFGSEVTRQLRRALGAVPGLAGQVPALSKAIQNGESSQLLARAPAAERARLAHATLASYAHGLDVVLFIGGVVALASALGALVLIRTKDFETSSQRSHGQEQGEGRGQAIGAARGAVTEAAPA
jgi:hypothetical protein